MNRVKAATFLLFASITNQAFCACSPSVSESKAGGNIVITNNCGLSDEDVLDQLEKFKSEQIKSSKSQNRNQRELVRQFNKNQQETAAKLDQILDRVQTINSGNPQKPDKEITKDTNIADEKPVAPQPSNEESILTMENNYRTILNSIKTHPLGFQEELVARLLLNQDIKLDCIKIREIVVEARNKNRYTQISSAFFQRISPLIPRPLSQSCFQELTKGVSAESADIIISILKSTENKTSASASASPRIESKQKNTQNASIRSIRPIVKSFTAALGNESGGYRLEAIKATIDSLPTNLSADEIKAILSDETGGYKESIIKTLVSKTQSNSLDPSRIADILNPDEGGYRYNQVLLLSPYIRPPIEASDAIDILNNLYGSQRGTAISLLSEKIRTPLSEDSIKLILSDIAGEPRRNAIKSLIKIQSYSLAPQPKVVTQKK